MTSYPPAERFVEVFNLVEAHIERKYGIPVVIRDVPDPFTGDLDGARIEVDYDQSCEDALFIVAHLFGHTVQWNTDPRARRLGTAPVGGVDEQFLEELRDYEAIACRYSLQLLRDAGVFDFDQWMSDFAGCDSAYLMHFYRTGEKRPFRSFWREGMPLLEPLAIPPFSIEQWVSRSAGVVI